MTAVREIMTADARCVQSDETAADAARKMTEYGVGALPICGPDNKIKGVVTDRDLVRKVFGQGRDPGRFPAGDLNQEEAATIGADDSDEEILATMTRYRVRRLPVIDNNKLVGMITLGDVAQQRPHSEVGELMDVLTAP